MIARPVELAQAVEAGDRVVGALVVDDDHRHDQRRGVVERRRSAGLVRKRSSLACMLREISRNVSVMTAASGESLPTSFHRAT